MHRLGMYPLLNIQKKYFKNFLFKPIEEEKRDTRIWQNPFARHPPGLATSPRLWAVTRRCFDIDLRIGQRRRLSILMARDRDSARCEAHVLLMILVYRGIPSLAIYSHRLAHRVQPRIVSALPGRDVICPREKSGRE